MAYQKIKSLNTGDTEVHRVKASSALQRGYLILIRERFGGLGRRGGVA